MRCVVVGAGAWGLPAAAELAGRGHEVVLADRYGIANALSSSPGPTRLWRLTHPDAVRVRLARHGLEAMERLGRRSGRTIFLRRGLLWRDDVSLPSAKAALTAQGVEHVEVAAADVGRFFPGLRPDARAAIWQEQAGPVLAAASMRAQAALFEDAGGVLSIGPSVLAIEQTPNGVRVRRDGGADLDADRIVLAPGPGAATLLGGLGIELPLRPRLEQVMHFGGPSDADKPCLFDGPTGSVPAMYAMPTPGVGYKVGFDSGLRDLTVGDDDRSPDPALIALATEHVRHNLCSITSALVDAQVCCWTDSPDGRFVIDSLPGGIVIGCGDCGEGFKFSALMGIVLADLAEGRTPDADVASFALTRFAGGFPSTVHVLGR